MRSGGGRALFDDVSFAEAFDSLPDPMVIVEEGGRIAAANHGAEQLLGYERSELIGQPVELLVPEGRRGGHEAHREMYLGDPSARPMGRGLDLEARCKDGSTIPVDISLSPLSLDHGQLVLVAIRDMTAQRIVEESLAAFAFIVQSSDDAIYQVDRDERIISWNPGAVRTTGFSVDDALGANPVSLFPEHRRAEDTEVLRRALKGERIERRQTELERRDGLVVPVELTASPLRDRTGRIVGASVIAHDITERRLAQDYLAESQARLQEAQELANVGMWTWDRHTDEVQYSEPLYHILGIDPAAFRGRFEEFVGCVAPGDRARVERALRRAVTSGLPVRLECAIASPGVPDGWMSMRAEAVHGPGGAVVGLRGILQDLTERHRAEVATREALGREREAAEQLRAADRLKDEFLSTVSHELRTPLTVIVGLSSVLASRPELDETAPDLIVRIKRNAEEMRGMIERLLDFSRLEAGRVVLHPVDLLLRTAIDQSLGLAEGELAGHVVVVDVDPALEVHADPDGMARVLGNLLTNAAKFSPAGTTVRIVAEVDGDDAVVRVCDQGNGLDPADAARVFERFFQVATDQRAGRRGTGVGLSIVQRYVEMHGGRVWVDSAVGQGATFAFTVPLVREAGA
jgi:PAS domain S-box-containing protein